MLNIQKHHHDDDDDGEYWQSEVETGVCEHDRRGFSPFELFIAYLRYSS